MTVSSVTPVNNYTGNNSTTTFDFDFYIESASELTVTLINSNSSETTLVLNQDYSIHEIGNSEGSYITFPLASSSHSVLSSNEKISLALSLDIEQETEFPACENLDLPTLEKTFDYLTRLIQILNRKTERAVKIQEGSSINVDTLVSNVNTIATDISSVNSVAGDLTNIDAVKNGLTNIDTVSTNIASVNTVAGVSSAVTNLSSVATDISTVSGISSAVSTVAGISSSVSAVADVSSDVSTVASNSSNITTCASNINAITSAPTYVAIATEKANLAKAWASKENTPVEGSLYSAKYYAEQSQQQGGTTYAVVRASKSYLDDGTLLTDTEGLADVTSYAHSTFDSSKFTVVGSPTITDDGIVSNGGGLNYLSKTFSDNLLAGDFELNINVKLLKGYSEETRVKYCLYTYSTGFGVRPGIALRYEGSDNNLYVSWSNLIDSSTSEAIFGYSLVTANALNKLCFIRFKKTNNVYSIDYSEDGINYITKRTTTYTNETYPPTINSLAILRDNYATTSIDLKQFSIKVDGEEIFNCNKTGTDTYTINGSTVSIPYTLSKTGSKIVDSYYRTQVTSVYNAFGYAPYYTLNEGTNFTLPMGEVYGFIGKNDIIEYTNGTSGYRIWVKTGYCEQRGVYYGTIGAYSEYTVTLTKTYKDTNYIVKVTGSPADYIVGASVSSVNTFKHRARYFDDDTGSATTTGYVYWETSGYLADGQW